VIDPVLPADPIEQDLGVLVPEPPREDLAVVGEDLLGHAVAGERLGDGRPPERSPGASGPSR
jgi:hypothetical protein